MPFNPLAFFKRKLAADTSETVGIRGAGASSQAAFGDPINDADLLFAVKREPVAHRIVFQVAHDVFDNWFEVVEVSEKPDPDFNKVVQKVLSGLSTKAVFTQAAVFERLFGYSIVIVGFADYAGALEAPVDRPKQIRDLAAYSKLSFDVQSSDEDKDPDSLRFGLPVLYELSRGSGVAKVKVHFSRVIHFATRLLDHPWKGLSSLESVYDDLTVLRNERWGMGQTLFRYGSGFPDIEIQNASKKQLDEFEDSKQFKNLQAHTYFLHNEKQKVEFKGLAGRALDPEPYYLPVMENISAASGIPLAILRGAQAGALTGSDVNEREYFKLISDLQSLYEPYLWQLIDLLMEIGQIPQVEDYEIHWLGGFEMNEIDKSVADLNRARAEDTRSNFMTVNELRARADPPLDSLPDERPEGNIIPGLLQKQQPVSQFPKNNGGKQENEEDRNKPS